MKCCACTHTHARTHNTHKNGINQIKYEVIQTLNPHYIHMHLEEPVPREVGVVNFQLATLAFYHLP